MLAAGGTADKGAHGVPSPGLAAPAARPGAGRESVPCPP